MADCFEGKFTPGEAQVDVPEAVTNEIQAHAGFERKLSAQEVLAMNDSIVSQVADHMGSIFQRVSALPAPYQADFFHGIHNVQGPAYDLCRANFRISA